MTLRISLPPRRATIFPNLNAPSIIEIPRPRRTCSPLPSSPPPPPRTCISPPPSLVANHTENAQGFAAPYTDSCHGNLTSHPLSPRARSSLQAKLHAYNAVLLKVKSLHAWSDPGRTKVWVAAVSLLATVLAIVPARYVRVCVCVRACVRVLASSGLYLPFFGRDCALYALTAVVLRFFCAVQRRPCPPQCTFSRRYPTQ